jgi:hypothetical protein
MKLAEVERRYKRLEQRLRSEGRAEGRAERKVVALQSLGAVHAGRRIPSESREAHILFRQKARQPAPPRMLGVLGRIAKGTVLIEVFRNAPGDDDVRACLAKLFDLRAADLRAARRTRRPASKVPLPSLWIIAPSLSRPMLARLGARPARGWPRGTFRLGEVLGTHLVSCRDLPENPDTLCLRLLGRDAVRHRALDELEQRRDAMAHATLNLIATWSVTHEEDAMKLAEVERRYKRLEQRLRAEGKAEGKTEGRAEGKAVALLAVLEARGVPTSQAAQRRIERCRDARTLDLWLRRAPFVERAAQLFR